MRWLARHSHLYGLLSQMKQRFRREPSHVERVRDYGQSQRGGERHTTIWDETRDLLQQMAQVANESGAAFVVVYLPELASLELDDSSAMDELERTGLPVLSVFAALQGERQGNSMRLRFRHDGHYNTLAHGVIAEAIASALLAPPLLDAIEWQEILETSSPVSESRNR